MRVSSVEAVFRSLNSRGVKYLVVGGLAVNAHGYGRVTFDIDLVVALERENVKRVFQALADLEFRPLAPVSAVDFSDRDIRDRLRREKGMMVLQFLSESHRETSVDIFAECPFDFDEEYQRAVYEEVGEGILVPFVALQCLIRMKESSGRRKDRDDLEVLRSLAEGDVRDES